VYAKVFGQIFDSSIAEDFQVRHVFMDLLVLANREGIIDMTIESIARRTNVPENIVREAIGKLCEPDVNSRSPNDEGRRIIALDDHRDWGWQIVNFQEYHAMRDENARREYMKAYMRRRRAKAKDPLTPVNSVNTRKPQLAHVHVDTDIEGETYDNGEECTKVSLALKGFSEFWKAYPRKIAKKAAQRAWKTLSEVSLETILAAVEAQKKTKQWQEKRFIPYPATWLNRGSWEDEVTAADTESTAGLKAAWGVREVTDEEAAAILEELPE